MSTFTRKYSTGGCLTCKRRKKKCDEVKPICRRCIAGDFHCLGYGPANPNAVKVKPATKPEQLISMHDFSLLGDARLVKVESRHRKKRVHSFANIPKRGGVDPVVLNNLLPVILLHYGQLLRQRVFKPRFPIEDELRRRANCSEITLRSMYIGAKVIEDMSTGGDGSRYTHSINSLYQRITERPPSTQSIESSIAHLSSIHNLAMLTYMISDTSTGYSIFRECFPAFLQLATNFPQLWSKDSTISISEAVKTPQFDVLEFMVHDTFTALALGIPPLVNYDPTSCWVSEGQNPLLELAYGLPAGVVITLAKINSWRVSRIMGQAILDEKEWGDSEACLRHWSPVIERTGESFGDIVRLAVQEAWRQAVLIYLYMGVCGTSSVDPRVESAAGHIARIVFTIDSGSLQEAHMFIPCLIAGVATRQEEHRAIIRNKMGTFQKEAAFILRGADFVVVLDHLWSTTGIGGNPVTWDDFIRSRCVTLPIAIDL